MEKQTISVGNLRRIIKESSHDFKAKMGVGVENDNKKNNDKSYKESKKRAKDFDGATLDETPKKEKLDRTYDNNRTTLGYTLDNEPSKEYKDRVKAQAKGYTSVADEKKGSKEHNAELDDEARIYSSIKDNETSKQKKKDELAHSGLVSSKTEKKEKNNMFENKTLQTKRLIFKKTTFLNEKQMLSRIPEEYKVDGQKIYMKDKSDNEYVVEFTKSQKSGLLETYIIGFNNQKKLDEQMNRVQELFNYNSVSAKGNQTKTLRESENKNMTDLLNIARNLKKENDEE